MRLRTAAAPAGIFAFAYLLRFLYLRQMAASPFFDFLQLDPLYYHDWAVAIASGDWIGKEVFEQSPLYSYLLALYMLVFGRDLYLLRLIQIGVGSVSCVLVYLLGARLFDRRTGIFAGLGCALYGPFFFYEGQVMKEFLTPPLATGALLLALRRRPPGLAPLAGAGALIGLACLVRDNFLLLLAVLALWLVFDPGVSTGRGRLAAPLSLMAGALAVLLPVGIRNLAVGGGFVLTTSGGGEVFYIGNGPYANGAYVPPPWVRSNPRFEHEDFRKKAREMTGRDLTRSEASRFWWKEGARWLAANPGRALRLWARKFALFWNDHELPDNYSYYTFKRFSWLLGYLLTFGPVAALAWAGVALSSSDWRRLLPVYLASAGYMVSVLMVFNFGRFRLPLVPILLVFAARALALLPDAARALTGRAPSRVPRLRAAVAILLAALPFMYIDLSSGAEEPFQDRLHLSAAYRQAGRAREAESTLRQVIADAEQVARRHGGDPTRAATTPGGITFVLALSAAHRDLGGILMDDKRYAEAAREYRAASDLSPGDASCLISLGGALKAGGDLEGAAAAYRNAAAIDPASFAARFDLATVYYEMGRMPEALSELEAARRAMTEPTPLDLADYHYAMGAVLYAIPGREREAVPHFTEALRLNSAAPQAAEVREALARLAGPPSPPPPPPPTPER
ncbi:MAG TPA: glycosyltransferase family 39 protein [Candidatus Polarisedimenticolia bacterium]|jgi:tetratricopeptide (TPR) repeat protein